MTKLVPCPNGCGRMKRPHTKVCHHCYVRSPACRTCQRRTPGMPAGGFCSPECREAYRRTGTRNAGLGRGCRVPAPGPPEDPRPRFGWVVRGLTVAEFPAGSAAELEAALLASPRPAGGVLWVLRPSPWCLTGSGADPVALCGWCWEIACGEVPCLVGRSFGRVRGGRAACFGGAR